MKIIIETSRGRSELGRLMIIWLAAKQGRYLPTDGKLSQVLYDAGKQLQFTSDQEILDFVRKYERGEEITVYQGAASE